MKSNNILVKCHFVFSATDWVIMRYENIILGRMIGSFIYIMEG